ncbi:TetR/AcrR family transcriptional regulator [Vibrio barjaei]|uniref:TetR/AcrR family transcriptional regulator n=1 Tax=Vibrio barjaei TaxID=1676683 RepID=UPI002283380E|nr:TetR/AcrR family transcriptional regulator [Vibrio barjaei]MCG9788624.1 TetR/AcrR family transcriptional regulator [Vibrio mediterranei]MCY9871874.1 TetR/AcrR family transcriptional regulator [Vibrio barjaei]
MTAKRQRILEVALELATTAGIDSLSTIEVAKQADVAKATLFHHFKSKQTLVNAIYESIKTDYDFFTGHESLDINARLELLWRESLSWAIVNPEKVAFLSMYYTSRTVPREARQRAKQQSLDGLHRLIQEAQHHNGLQNESTEVLMESVYSMFMSTAQNLVYEEPQRHALFVDGSTLVFKRLLNCPTT